MEPDFAKDLNETRKRTGSCRWECILADTLTSVSWSPEQRTQQSFAQTPGPQTLLVNQSMFPKPLSFWCLSCSNKILLCCPSHVYNWEIPLSLLNLSKSIFFLFNQGSLRDEWIIDVEKTEPPNKEGSFMNSRKTEYLRCIILGLKNIWWPALEKYIHIYSHGI